MHISEFVERVDHQSFRIPVRFVTQGSDKRKVFHDISTLQPVGMYSLLPIHVTMYIALTRIPFLPPDKHVVPDTEAHVRIFPHSDGNK